MVRSLKQQIIDLSAQLSELAQLNETYQQELDTHKTLLVQEQERNDCQQQEIDELQEAMNC